MSDAVVRRDRTAAVAPSRVRAALTSFAVGLRQFWKGYWLSPTIC